VRELSSTSDSAAQAGKLVAELDHVRAKEGLTRSALNRSELERLELERQARGLKQQVGRLTLQLAIAQDQGRCVVSCGVVSCGCWTARGIRAAGLRIKMLTAPPPPPL
jgi:hypothetical protein